MFNKICVHLIGIGGVSMSSIALMMLSEGATVTGSDIQKSKFTSMLEEKGVVISYDHSTDLVTSADIVVYTAAIAEDDPEMIKAKKEGKKLYERSTALGLLMKEYKNVLCISGTHGKSTTTGMTASVFLQAGLNPTIQVGATMEGLDCNTHIGSKDYFIVESCEYVDSFLSFHPTSVIVTNIDNDHLDYFKNLDNIKKSFNKFVNLIPKDGYLIKNNDDTNSIKLTSFNTITFGINNESNYMAKNITKDDNGYYSYDLIHNNEFITNINLSINGYHNIYNSLACFALSNCYIKDINTIKKGIESFHGVGRRFEYLGKYNDALIYDDYAHHPTEIETTYKSSLEVKHNKTWAVFQSHTYSRTKEHLGEFAKVLSKFDNIVIAPIYPAREINTFNISEDMLVDKIKETNKNVIYIDSFDKIIDYLKQNIKPNDLVITIGAGPVNKIAQEIVK